jgi:hypothetical protein
LRALGEIKLVFERKHIEDRHFDSHISTLHCLIELPFGYVAHRYVCYILARGICNIRLCVRDMSDGILLEKTPLLVVVTECFLLRQLLDGDEVVLPDVL